MAQEGIYYKLRPPQPTPEEELCKCDGMPPIKLMHALGHNPVHCMNCNLEVRPETLGFSGELAEEIADWNYVYGAVYLLWLDSKEYEDWTIRQLLDISSPVNVRGRRVQVRLSDIRRCFYWYFQDQSSDDYLPASACPSCHLSLLSYSQGIFEQMVCDRCSIVVVGE